MRETGLYTQRPHGRVKFSPAQGITALDAALLVALIETGLHRRYPTTSLISSVYLSTLIVKSMIYFIRNIHHDKQIV